MEEVAPLIQMVVPRTPLPIPAPIDQAVTLLDDDDDDPNVGPPSEKKDLSYPDFSEQVEAIWRSEDSPFRFATGNLLDLDGVNTLIISLHY